MVKVVSASIITILFSCLALGLFVFLKDKTLSHFIYGVVMVSGNLVLPMFLGAIIYELIIRKAKVDYVAKAFIFKVIFVCVIIQIILMAFVYSGIDYLFE